SQAHAPRGPTVGGPTPPRRDHAVRDRHDHRRSGGSELQRLDELHQRPRGPCWRRNIQHVDHSARHHDPRDVLVPPPGIQGPNPHGPGPPRGSRIRRGRRLHGGLRLPPHDRLVHHVPLRGPVRHPPVPPPS